MRIDPKQGEESELDPNEASNMPDDEASFLEKLNSRQEQFDEFMESTPGHFLAYGARSAKIAVRHGGGKGGLLKGLIGGIASRKTLFLFSVGPTIFCVVGVIILIYLVGPLQFVQAAQMLEKYHFGAVNSFADGRTTKLFRYYAWSDKPQNRRLTLLANSVTDVIDLRFKQAGMEVNFDDRGVMRSLTIDTKKFPADDLEKLRGDFEVTDVGSDGRFVKVNADKLSGRKSRQLFDRTRVSLGLGGFGGWLQARLPLNRINPSLLHPIRKLDEAILEKAGDARLKWKERKEKITQSAESPDIRGSPTETDEDGNPKPNVSDDAAAAVDDLAHVDAELTGEPKITAVQGNVSKALGVAGAVNAITGITCLVYTMANIAGDFEFNNVAEPSMSQAGYQIGLGNQVKNREDLQAEQLKFENETMYDESNDGNPNTKPSSFFDNRALQTEGGRDPTGPDTPNSAKIGGAVNVLTQLKDGIPGIGQWLLNGGCGLVSSPIGQVFTFSIDLFLAPASAVAGYTASLFTGPLLNDLAHFIAGSQISNDLAGAAKGGVANQGAFLLGDEQFATNGAQPLSDADRTGVRRLVEAEQKEETQNESFSERYFALTNPDSLFGTIGRSRIPSAGSAIASLLDIPKNLASVTGLFTARAHAVTQTNYDYGVPKFGYTPSELNLLDNDESYANPFVNAAAISDTQLKEFHQKYGEKCFGLKFDDQEHFTMTKTIDLKKLADDQSYSECRRTDPEFLHYRVYIADLMNFDSFSCWEGNDASCEELGFASDSSQDSADIAPVTGTGFKGEDTSSLPCKIGTDAGIGDTPDPTKKIRLCKVGGKITVNVAIEQNVKNVLDGAAGAGIANVGGGGYRSYQAQIDARKRNGCPDIYTAPPSKCRVPTARPGQSMHEWGLAVDFAIGKDSIASGSPLFNWLKNNQSKHQLTNLASEPWHWSSTGT